MKFTSDRQRKAAFWSMRNSSSAMMGLQQPCCANKFSDTSKRVAMIVGKLNRDDIDEFVKVVFDDPDMGINSIAVVDKDDEGLSEVYVESPKEVSSRSLIQYASILPESKVVFLEDGVSLDDIIGDRFFKDRSGRKINKEKPGIYWRDPDERSEDYVSKGDYIDERPRNKYRFSKKKDKGYTSTVDGYECDNCGEEFGTKAAASIHASMCKDNDSDTDYSDDGVPVDSFFSNDDGTW